MRQFQNKQTNKKKYYKTGGKRQMFEHNTSIFQRNQIYIEM